MKNIIFILIFTLCSSISFNCTQSEGKKGTTINMEDSLLQVTDQDSILLRWDHPTETPDSIDHYELYYRTNREAKWQFLKNSGPAKTFSHITVNRNEIDLTDSIFYFAVRSVAINGKKSIYHSSTDVSAVPNSWCLYWKSK